MIGEIEKEAGVDAGLVNPYFLEGKVCLSSSPQATRIKQIMARRASLSTSSSSSSSAAAAAAAAPPPPPYRYSPCTEDYTTSYLNKAAVQAALHVYTHTEWNFCSDPVFENWPLADTIADVTSLYSRVHNLGVKMLIYSGDADGVCATQGTQQWIFEQGGKIIELWQPWFLPSGAQAGFLTKFENVFSFATVHDAGHEVPAYQPVAALHLFDLFLRSDAALFANVTAQVVGGGGDGGAGLGVEGEVAVIFVSFAVLAAVFLGLIAFVLLLRSSAITKSTSHSLLHSLGRTRTRTTTRGRAGSNASETRTGDGNGAGAGADTSEEEEGTTTIVLSPLARR